jgi:hypothetical protein
MPNMFMLATLLAGATPSIAASAAAGAWAHVGNTYNSAIFVDRAILADKGAQRHFRTLHVNVQPSAGWRSAEHRGVIDCAARTLRYQGVVMTKTDGRRQALPSASAAPVPFPARGVLRDFATSVCAGKLGPPVRDPEAWTKTNFRPG